MSTVLSTDKEGNSGNGNDEGFDTISAASLLHAWATSQPNSAANSRAGSRVGSRAASPAAENAGAGEARSYNMAEQAGIPKPMAVEQQQRQFAPEQVMHQSMTPANLYVDRAPPGEASSTFCPDKAYAKLSGDNFVYYVQTMSVVLGRASKATGGESEGEPDVDLGRSKSISRKHATIKYNPRMEAFFIEPHGKNGINVDLTFYERGSGPVRLNNWSRVQIANIGFWFILPQGDVTANTQPLTLAAQLHLRHLMSRSPSPSPTITQPNSQVPSRQTSRQASRAGSVVSSIHEDSDHSGEDHGYAAASGGGGVPHSFDPTQKPHLTYAELIIDALQEHGGRLSLKSIYNAIMKKHAYYRHLKDQDGWKNSIRHNLSLNSAFKKTKRLQHEPVVKGNYWIYDPPANYVPPKTGRSPTNLSAPKKIMRAPTEPVRGGAGKSTNAHRRKKQQQRAESSLRHVHSAMISPSGHHMANGLPSNGYPVGPMQMQPMQMPMHYQPQPTTMQAMHPRQGMPGMPGNPPMMMHG